MRIGGGDDDVGVAVEIDVGDRLAAHCAARQRLAQRVAAAEVVLAQPDFREIAVGRGAAQEQVVAVVATELSDVDADGVRREDREADGGFDGGRLGAGETGNQQEHPTQYRPHRSPSSVRSAKSIDRCPRGAIDAG